MAELLFTIPIDATTPARPAGDGLAAGVAMDAGPPPERDFYGVWEDDAGQPVGDPLQLGRTGEVVLEHPGGDGSFDSTSVRVPLAFAADPPASASHLSVGTAAGVVARLSMDALTARPAQLPAPRTAFVGAADGRFVFPVIAERFAAWEPFFAKVGELYDWIVGRPELAQPRFRGQPPFNEPAVRAGFGLKAIFWPSDPATGMFGADDGEAEAGGQLFYGDRERAKALIDPWLDDRGRPSLILINSTRRGGAGGTPGYSAWSSIAETPGEDWQAVGLHEIGHALGLGDEYVQQSRAGEIPAQLEPNVSRNARAGSAPWAHLITVPPEAAPSHDLAHQAALDDAIGTFQGARYREDFYRPMQDCLMRQTRAPFCEVCRAHIRAMI